MEAPGSATPASLGATSPAASPVALGVAPSVERPAPVGCVSQRGASIIVCSRAAIRRSAAVEDSTRADAVDVRGAVLARRGAVADLLSPGGAVAPRRPPRRPTSREARLCEAARAFHGVKASSRPAMTAARPACLTALEAGCRSIRLALASAPISAVREASDGLVTCMRRPPDTTCLPVPPPLGDIPVASPRVGEEFARYVLVRRSCWPNGTSYCTPPAEKKRVASVRDRHSARMLLFSCSVTSGGGASPLPSHRHTATTLPSSHTCPPFSVRLKLLPTAWVALDGE